MNGKFKAMLCNITMCVGIAASLFGIVTIFILSPPRAALLFVLYMVALVFSILLRKMAKHFVTLYEDKRRETEEKLNEIRLRRGDTEDKPYYTDETFDDPELRFGKGGYTDNNL